MGRGSTCLHPPLVPDGGRGAADVLTPHELSADATSDREESVSPAACLVVGLRDLIFTWSPEVPVDLGVGECLLGPSTTTAWVQTQYVNSGFPAAVVQWGWRSLLLGRYPPKLPVGQSTPLPAALCVWRIGAPADSWLMLPASSREESTSPSSLVPLGLLLNLSWCSLMGGVLFLQLSRATKAS